MARQKLAMVREAMAANTPKLRQYRWIETTQVMLKGEQKPATQKSCQYGPDGTAQKTPMGPPRPPGGAPLMRRMIEKKQAEMKPYMGAREGGGT